MTAIGRMIGDMRKDGIDVEIIGKPDHGVVIHTKVKP